MKILILGGTKFLGRHLVQAASAHNHQVTLFNRGRTNAELFPEIEKLRGNRDGNLQALKGRTWDVVIDTCGFVSGQVRAAARLLAASVERYVFISSISVYRDFTKIGLDESMPLEQLPAGAIEEEGNGDTYGARKALCEQAAEEAMPGKVLSVRAGLIVGPHDTSGRFLYWVRRVARGGEILAPGDPNAPVQLIDVRDLAGWIIRMAASGSVGVFNATGPASRLPFYEMIERCIAPGAGAVRMTWIEDQFLLENGVAPFKDLPLWLPPPSHQGFFAVDCRCAFASGLKCRSLLETVQDIREWDRGTGSEGQIGLEPEREQELLRKWKSKCAGESAKNKTDVPQ